MIENENELEESTLSRPLSGWRGRLALWLFSTLLIARVELGCFPFTTRLARVDLDRFMTLQAHDVGSSSRRRDIAAPSVFGLSAMPCSLCLLS